MERILSKYICLLCIPLGVLVLFSGRYFLSYIGDEYYMALCVRDYQNCPLGFLTFYTGNIWCDFWGFTLLSLRTLSRFAYLVAIGVSVSYMYRKTRNIVLTSTVFLLSAFIATLGGFGFYDWNTAAYPSESILTVLLLVYVHNPSRGKIVFIGLVTGLVIMFRVTMIPILILDIVILILIGRERSLKYRCIDITILLITSALSVCVLLLCICGSPKGVLMAFDLNNIISGHNLEAVDNFIWRFKLLFPFIFMSWTAGFICYYLAFVSRGSNKKSVSFIASVLVCLITGWCVLRMIALQFDYSTDIFGLGFPYVIIPSFIFPFLVFGKSKDGDIRFRGLRLRSSVILVMLFMMGFGSDSFPERWHASFLLPIAIAETYPFLSNDDKKVYGRWFMLSIVMMIGILLYKSYAIRKEFVWTEKVHPVYSGLPMDRNISSLVDDIEGDVRYLESQGKRFTFWGAYHQTLSLMYEKEPAFSIQLFHLAGKDIADHVSDIESIDYVFVPYVGDTSLYSRTLESLENHGFKEVKITKTFVLYENKNNGL